MRAVRPRAPLEELVQTFFTRTKRLAPPAAGRTRVVAPRRPLVLMRDRDHRHASPGVGQGFWLCAGVRVRPDCARRRRPHARPTVPGARDARAPRSATHARAARRAPFTACAWVTLLCGLAVVHDAHGAPPPASTISLVSPAAVVVFLTRSLRRSRHRASAAGVNPGAVPTADEDALADLETPAGPARWHRLRLPGPLNRTCAVAVLDSAYAPHPWRMATLVALGAGLGARLRALPPVRADTAVHGCRSRSSPA